MKDDNIIRIGDVCYVLPPTRPGRYINGVERYIGTEVTVLDIRALWGDNTRYCLVKVFDNRPEINFTVDSLRKKRGWDDPPVEDLPEFIESSRTLTIIEHTPGLAIYPPLIWVDDEPCGGSNVHGD